MLHQPITAATGGFAEFDADYARFEREFARRNAEIRAARPADRKALTEKLRHDMAHLTLLTDPIIDANGGVWA